MWKPRKSVVKKRLTNRLKVSLKREHEDHDNKIEAIRGLYRTLLVLDLLRYYDKYYEDWCHWDIRRELERKVKEQHDKNIEALMCDRWKYKNAPWLQKNNVDQAKEDAKQLRKTKSLMKHYGIPHE